ncbi:hypothetical protein ACFQV2_19830 [Actinokineospora soli]|uniref:Nitroreductase domain-containing protein n=1 Tax=Actinokineospora soli TaxID=1048753 RepID=A0ABW2TNP8_9PSEU
MSPEWTTAEAAVLSAAARSAPSVHRTRPWVVETRGREVLVVERVDLRLPEHDPTGRDRLISCGAAVACVRLAVRRLGWSETWRQFPLPGRRDVVAAVRAGEPRPPTAEDSARYAAMRRRRSHRSRFAGPPDPGIDLRHATDVEGAAVVALAGPAADAALAALITHTARLMGRSAAYRGS